MPNHLNFYGKTFVIHSRICSIKGGSFKNFILLKHILFTDDLLDRFSQFFSFLILLKKFILFILKGENKV